MADLALRDEKKFKEIVSSTLDYVRPKVHYADLLIEKAIKVEAKLLSDGQELNVPYSSKAAMQLRLVKDDGRHLHLAMGLVDEDEMRQNIDIAIATLEGSEPDDTYGLAPVPNPGKQRYGKLPKMDIRDVDSSQAMARIINEVKGMAKQAEKTYGVNFNPEVWFFSQIEEKVIADTEGLYKTQVLPSTFLQVHVKARKDDRVTQFRIRHADIEGLEMIIADDSLNSGARQKIGSALENAAKLLRARELTDEEMKKLTHYVLNPSTMVFVHEAHGHNFEADGIKEGASGLIDEKGNPREERIASEIVDIYDGQPMDENGDFIYDKGFGTEFIDDEGVELKPVQLVRSGKIVGKLHNRETAHFYGEEPNGHGFSELGDQRVVRMTNTYIVPNSKVANNVEELIAEVKFGVLLDGSLGGQVSKEGMSTSIQIGRLIEDGKLTEEVLLPANMSVVTKSSLLSAEGFAGKIIVNDDAGFCGKEAQTKYVTDGGPIMKLAVSDSVSLAY